MISPEQISLAILAGGAGERMGIPKSLLEIDRVPILEYLLGHLNWPGPTLLVTAPGRENPPGHQSFNHQVIDPVAGLGPLRGILTALEFSKTDIIVITTVDMPNIRREHLNWLATELTACPNVFGLMLQPKGDGEAIEPFPCAFRRAAQTIIATRLSAGNRSVHKLADDPAIVVIPAPASWPADTWLNLNTAEDLARFTKGAANPAMG